MKKRKSLALFMVVMILSTLISTFQLPVSVSAAAISTLPYNETFLSTSLPEGWTSEGTAELKPIVSTNSYEGTGTWCLALKNPNNSAYFQIDATNYSNLVFSFYYRQKTSSPKGDAIVAYSIDGGATYKTLADITTTTGKTTHQQMIYNLQGADHKADVRIRIAAGSNASDSGYVAIDKICVKSDAGAPTWTSGSLSATGSTATETTLSWSAATDDTYVTGYKIYKDGSLLNTVATTTAKITDLTPGTTYSFKVEAVDILGNESTTGPATSVALDFAGVLLDNDNISIWTNQPFVLTPTVKLPSGFANNSVAWAVYDSNGIESSSVASLAVGPTSATVTGVSGGTAKVRVLSVADSTYFDDCNVTVKVPVTGLSLNQTSATVSVGGNLSLVSTVSPSNATNSTVTWVSSDSTIAEVNPSSGVVTGVKAGGPVTITARNVIQDPSYEQVFSAQCEVTVTVPVAGETVQIYATDFTDFPAAAPPFPTKASSTGLVPDVNTIISSIPSNSWYYGYILNGAIAKQSLIRNDSSNANTPPSNIKFSNSSSTLVAGTVGVSTSGYENIIVSYYDKAPSSTIPTRHMYFQYSTDAGETWKTFNQDMTTVTTSEPEYTYIGQGAYNLYTFNISEADTTVNDNSFCLFRIRQASYIKPTSTYVDDFVVTGSKISTIPVTSMELNYVKETIDMNKNLQMAVTSVAPSNATGLSVMWTSDDPSVAEVDAVTGLVTGTGPGTATITAKNMVTGVTSTCSLTVLKVFIPVSKVNLSRSTLSLYNGQTSQLSATVEPSNADDQRVTWSTEDSIVATVDATGLVTAIAPGTTNIRVACVDQAVYSVGQEVYNVSQPVSYADCLVTVIEETDILRSISTFGFTNNDNGVSTNPRAAGVIDQNTKTITINVPKGSDVSNAVATFVKSSNVQSVWIGDKEINTFSFGYAQTTPMDFTNTVTMKVYGVSNTQTNYTVIVNEKDPTARAPKIFEAYSSADITAYCQQALPGDTIIMKNSGNWTDADIYFAGDGEEGNPITLKAETQGGVILQGASRITISGSYLVVDGMNFFGRSDIKLDSVVKFDRLSYNSRLTNTVINDYNTTNTALTTYWLVDYGTYNRIDHNTFEHKATLGELLRIWRGIDSHCQVDYNYFANRDATPGVNGSEAIQVGMYLSTGNWDTAPSHSIIEHNYFYNWKGDIELISVKSHNNIIRYNTMEKCPTTITLRIADYCEVYGNYFLDDGTPSAGGIRVYGKGHKIYNNYFSGTSGSGDQNTAIALQTGTASPTDDCQPATDVIVAYNTIVNSNGVGAISVGAAPGSTTVSQGSVNEKVILKTVGPQNIIIANNIILGSAGKAFYTPSSGIITATIAQYEGNIIYGIPSGLSDSTSGITVANPLLSISDEVYRPTIGSPVLGAASSLYGPYSFVTDDMDGQIRPEVADIGADQASTEPVLRGILTAADVGPVVPDTDATLKSLSIADTDLSPDFAKDTLSYTARVSKYVESVNIAAVASSAVSTVKVNGDYVTASTTKAVNLQHGDNTVTILVTARDGSTKTYTVTIFRANNTTSTSVSVDTTTPGTKDESKPVVEFNKTSGVVETSVSSEALLKLNDGSKVIKIDVPKIEGAKAYETVLPTANLAQQTTVGVDIQIKTEIATVVLPSNMLKDSEVSKDGKVGLSIAPADTSKLDAKTKSAIGDRPIIELSLKVDGKSTAWNNPNAPVTVSIPYKATLEEMKNPEHIVVWYIDGTGKAIAVPSGRYDPTTGEVTFKTTHFSQYAIGYVQKTFNDLVGFEWAKNQIEVLASKGVIGGTTPETYDPSANITRADFMILLTKTLGITAETDVNFTDVQKSDYYYEAVGVAKKLGLSNGDGSNRFDPNTEITRQDMMALTVRALKYMDKIHGTGTAADLNKFSDASSIAAYAKDSVATMINEGLIKGDGNSINPLGDATRAEIAVLMYRIYNK